MRTLIAAVFLTFSSLCLAVEPPASAKRGVNLLRNPSFEESSDAAAGRWNAVGKGYATIRNAARDGAASVLCEAAADNESRGLMQEVTFAPPLKHPFKVSGWSRAENAQGYDYCLYMDCWYADGTNLWGQRRNFEPGTHDWQRIEYVFDVAKPVTKIQFFILFRRCTGKAWFDNVSLSLAPFEVEREKATPSLYGGNSIDYTARLSLPAKWTASVLQGNREVHSTTGEGRGVNLAWSGKDPGGAYTVRVVAKDDLFGEELRHEKRLQTRSGTGRGYVAWTESAMQRVLINSMPASPGTAPTARIALAENE
ncbi:MAG: hypothetical protein FJ272_12710, partial [Planctomycetes bacterium]|nr:hypothetical protein [Planctomycetota bacterium]